MSWGRTTADRWFLGLVAAAGTALTAVAYIVAPSHVALYVLFLVLYTFCYVPVAAIALGSAKLRGFLRYFFSLTAIPVFLVMLVCSIFLISGEFPSFYESYNEAMASGGGRRGMWWGILAVAPAAMAFWLWYRVLKIVDDAIYGSKDRGSVQPVQHSAPADADPRR